MPTLNQRRRETTRLEIAEAALALFAAHGYAQITAEAIADAAEVSLRTFYRYFSAKDEVLRPIVEVRARRMADAIAARPAQERLPVAVQRAAESLNPPGSSLAQPSPFIRVLTDSPEALQRWMRDLSVFEAPLTPVIQERIGSACGEDHVRYTAAAIVTALRIAFESALHAGDLGRFPERLGEVLAYFGTGAGLAPASSAPPPSSAERP